MHSHIIAQLLYFQKYISIMGDYKTNKNTSCRLIRSLFHSHMLIFIKYCYLYRISSRSIIFIFLMLFLTYGIEMPKEKPNRRIAAI